jgi:hypothetical protein
VLKVQRQLVSPDVFEHADAHQLIEAAGFIQLAIVTHFHSALVLWAGLRNPLARELSLVPTQSNPQNVDVIVLSCVNSQPLQPQPISSNRSPERSRSLRHR